MRILDLYSGAGGAAMGYHQAGWEVLGVDINPQPHYPFAFIQADALTFLEQVASLIEFDAIHASPPCQLYTTKPANWGRERTHWLEHPDYLVRTREALERTGLPYVIENVEGAPLLGQLLLCGTMFEPPGESGKVLIKHRIFEGNWPMPMNPMACNHGLPIYDQWQGKGRGADKHRDAQGTPWIPTSGGASRKLGYTGDLYNAIPPAYTEWIGKHLAAYVRDRVAA